MNENHQINGKKKTAGNNTLNKNLKWILILVITTIILSVSMSTLSSIIIERINFFAAVIILICIVLVGIIFDIIGIAVASADETPFHAMASSKLKGAKNAIKLVRNASKVTTFCNDVIGDVCSVISGSASAFIILKLSRFMAGIDIALLGIIISAFVAGITVLGKGLGKTIAISKSNKIVYKVGLLQYYILNGFIVKK